ncbi:flagellar motor protein MotB [Rhodobacter veldkampii DSM 11550]|uniref:Flagellar motor protein MotB n=1 Tax=Phaeovulum veldkampii DSM 11550 TaxID=1185920 RepID=A0A2T4JID1_9RHOB|nr:peptidoglycan -binding protein [Phaeovulum veldkampii]MBK5945559.1 flagellar motor protein MotB [Phaeovulum veldkampii DSM 11550]PTE17547.1 flagellar motor protein MotB [Phaeovulum veldkampii DSM 11550]TDQ60289.1 chemotaxis protein MotB [Phaeovulum veldkampii DSM 11550]
MALSPRGAGNRFSATIWPGFVDAMTALLMVLMFVLTIFMVVQSVLRDTITTQDSELDALSTQLAGLAEALALEQARASDLEGRLTGAEALVATLGADLAASRARIGEYEAQVAGLLAARAADAAAQAELQARLQGSEADLAALTLALDESRRKAEETLTLLAAAEAARRELEGAATQKSTDEERLAALLALAEQKLSQERLVSAEGARKLALLNEQIAALRAQLGALQAVLDESAARDKAAKVQIEALGAQLNTALAQVAAEQRKRADLEEAERKRLELETKDLARYRSEFFGRMSELLAGREGVQVVGDRFVFSSEVLFAPASADLAPEGRAQIARVAALLTELAGQIPPEIDWVIRVDGHTDSTPLSGTGLYADNWELSQARALSVVRYMTGSLGFPPARLAATGFGEYRPVTPENTPEARAQNRRIELKLTER